MKSLKSKFKWFSYSSSKWVVKDQRQLAISTMHLAQELLVNAQSLIAQLVKNLPAIQEVWVWFLGWEDPLEKEMATHSSIRAWRIPRMEEPGGLQSTGSQRVGQDWAPSLSLSFHVYCYQGRIASNTSGQTVRVDKREELAPRSKEQNCFKCIWGTQFPPACQLQTCNSVTPATHRVCLDTAQSMQRSKRNIRLTVIKPCAICFI